MMAAVAPPSKGSSIWHTASGTFKEHLSVQMLLCVDLELWYLEHMNPPYTESDYWLCRPVLFTLTNVIEAFQCLMHGTLLNFLPEVI